MQLIPGGDFWQDSIGKNYAIAKGLSEPPGGACFRYAAKWLLCKLYARPFKSYDADLTGREPFEVFSSTKGFDKQEQYLGALAQYEKPHTSYANFLAGVRAVSRDYLTTWGNKQTKTVKYDVSIRDREYRGLGDATAVLAADCAVLIGIFGSSRKYSTVHGRSVMEDENWAHALGYYHKGNEKRFFDSNGGEFDLGTDNPVTAIEQYATKFYTGFWKNCHFKDQGVDIGTPGNPRIVGQFERDLSKPAMSVMYAKGLKTIFHYVLFELTKK